MGRWYYLPEDSKDPTGPVSLETIVQLVRAGTLLDESLVRREESTQWAAVDEHREILEMLPFDREHLVLTYLRATARPEWPDEDWWAWDKLRRMIGAHPEVAWDLVTMLVRHAPSQEILAIVAAGPLEDLLVRHGELVIDRVDATAATDVKFRQCLARIWQNAMPDALWARVRAATRGQESL